MDLPHRRATRPTAVRHHRHERQDQRRRTCSTASCGQLGLVTGLSSTAERHIGDLAVDEPPHDARGERDARACWPGCARSTCAPSRIEVSAQALTRHRVDGLVFDVVAFTNLSHDHLDDYADMEEYFQAKLPLFQPERAQRGVVSLDTDWGARVVEESRIPVDDASSADSPRRRVADWVVEVLDETRRRTPSSALTGPEGRSLATRVPLIGWHMAANAALAIVMLVEAGFELEAIGARARRATAASTPTCPAAPSGSPGDRGPRVYVDFGHSPDAFVNTLGAIRRFTTGRIDHGVRRRRRPGRDEARTRWARIAARGSRHRW